MIAKVGVKQCKWARVLRRDVVSNAGDSLRKIRVGSAPALYVSRCQPRPRLIVFLCNAEWSTETRELRDTLCLSVFLGDGAALRESKTEEFSLNYLVFSINRGRVHGFRQEKTCTFSYIVLEPLAPCL
jgi:hypothetical protein